MEFCFRLGDDSSVVDMFSRRVGYATGMQMSPEDVEKWQVYLRQ